MSLDIFGPFPKTRAGFKHILVLMDQFSKLTKLYPITNQKVETITETIENRYFTEVQLRETILTDNGGQFASNKWIEFAEQIGFAIK